ncbi:MAG: hypothetical protein Q4D29_10475 [Lachnospiraceae bacterium]|nr:hypothetical protein [Lachnospiraceae bacterium]
MIVERIRSKINCICLIMLAAILLQGCGQERFAKEQAEMIVGKGRPILEQYVSSLPEEAHIININMLNGCKQGEPSFSASFPSHIVQAAFLAGDIQYTALVNLEDGKIYSNYDYIDPNEMIQRQLMTYLDEYGFNGIYEVSGAFYSYAFVSHQVEVKKGDVRDVYVYIDYIPDLAPVEDADEFMNASISGFDIEYETEDDEVFVPEILVRYLTDTGNYRKENMRGDNREYHIKGGRRAQNYVNGEPVYYEMDIISEGNPETMTCDILRWDYKEEDGFCYIYAGGMKNGKVIDIEDVEYEKYSCPFTFSGDELTYVRDDNNPNEGHLYVKSPEWNEISMTRYMLANKTADEKTNDIIDRWELEPIDQEKLEVVKSDFADLYELYIKGTKNKVEFKDDKVVVIFK